MHTCNETARKEPRMRAETHAPVLCAEDLLQLLGNTRDDRRVQLRRCQDLTQWNGFSVGPRGRCAMFRNGQHAVTSDCRLRPARPIASLSRWPRNRWANDDEMTMARWWVEAHMGRDFESIAVRPWAFQIWSWKK